MCSIGDVIQSLAETGYKGDCLELEHLRYAVRVGACSWQYLELVSWLERQFEGSQNGAGSNCTNFDFIPLFKELRSSYLKKSSGAPSDPAKLRWSILEYMINVLKSALEKKGVLNKQPRRELGQRLPTKTLNDAQSVWLQRSESSKLLAEWDVNGDQSKNIDTKHIDKKCEEIDTSMKCNGMLHFLLIKESSPTGEISKTHWQQIKNTLEEHLLPAIDNDEITSAEANGIYFDKLLHNDQLRVVVCSNVDSGELLRQTVSLVLQQEHLSILPYSEVDTQFVVTAWVWISKIFNDLTMILDLIALHNSLSTDDWCVIKVGPTAGSGGHYLLKLDRSALPVLERSGGYLNFGQSQIYLRLNKELRADFDFLSLQMGTFIRNF